MQPKLVLLINNNKTHLQGNSKYVKKKMNQLIVGKLQIANDQIVSVRDDTTCKKTSDTIMNVEMGEMVDD